jgi:hypothetical protein
MDFKEVGCGCVDWINLLHDKENRQSHVNTAIALEVSKTVADFLASQEYTRFSRRLCSMELVQSLHCSSYFMSGYYLVWNYISICRGTVLQMVWESLWKS